MSSYSLEYAFDSAQHTYTVVAKVNGVVDNQIEIALNDVICEIVWKKPDNPDSAKKCTVKVTNPVVIDSDITFRLSTYTYEVRWDCDKVIVRTNNNRVSVYSISYSNQSTCIFRCNKITCINAFLSDTSLNNIQGYTYDSQIRKNAYELDITFTKKIHLESGAIYSSLSATTAHILGGGEIYCLNASAIEIRGTVSIHQIKYPGYAIKRTERHYIRPYENSKATIYNKIVGQKEDMDLHFYTPILVQNICFKNLDMKYDNAAMNTNSHVVYDNVTWLTRPTLWSFELKFYTNTCVFKEGLIIDKSNPDTSGLLVFSDGCIAVFQGPLSGLRNAPVSFN